MSSITLLWCLARPMHLPRRAHLALNAVLAMSAVQVNSSVFRESFLFLTTLEFRKGPFPLPLPLPLPISFVFSSLSRMFTSGFQVSVTSSFLVALTFISAFYAIKQGRYSSRKPNRSRQILSLVKRLYCLFAGNLGHIQPALVCTDTLGRVSPSRGADHSFFCSLAHTRAPKTQGVVIM